MQWTVFSVERGVAVFRDVFTVLATRGVDALGWGDGMG
jgi:hypothetical protein